MSIEILSTDKDEVLYKTGNMHFIARLNRDGDVFEDFYNTDKKTSTPWLFHNFNNLPNHLQKIWKIKNGL